MKTRVAGELGRDVPADIARELAPVLSCCLRRRLLRLVSGDLSADFSPVLPGVVV